MKGGVSRASEHLVILKELPDRWEMFRHELVIPVENILAIG